MKRSGENKGNSQETTLTDLRALTLPDADQYEMLAVQCSLHSYHVPIAAYYYYQEDKPHTLAIIGLAFRLSFGG